MKIYDLRALRNPKNSIYDPPCVAQLHGHHSSRSLALVSGVLIGLTVNEHVELNTCYELAYCS